MTLKHSSGELIWSRVGILVGVCGLALSVAGGAIGGVVSNAARDARTDTRIETLEQHVEERRSDWETMDTRLRAVEADTGVTRAGVQMLLQAHQLREPKERSK